MTGPWVVLQGIPVTLLLWAAGQLGGGLLAVPVAAARMSTRRTVRLVATIWIEGFRGIPTLVWVFVIFFGLGTVGLSFTSLTAGALTLALVSSAHLAEAYRSGWEAVPRLQGEAALAIGLPRHIRLRRVMFPQAAPLIIAGAGSYSMHLLKETALISLIGVVDIMAIANYQVERGGNGFILFLLAGVIYFGLSLVIAGLARWGSRALAPTGVSA